MKLRCERDVLVEALATAGRAAGRPGAGGPGRGGVHLALTGDQLVATGTDLDLTIEVRTTVSGQGDGVVVVPGRLAADIVRSLEPGAVSVDAGDGELRIAAGRSQFSVRQLSTDDFPRVPAPTGDPVELQAGDLAAALHQVVRAASQDDGVPVITGVLLAAHEGGLRLVATDRYRLAVADLPGVGVLRDGQRVLVPSRALKELERFLAGAEAVTLQLGERDATFTVGGTRLTTRLVEGEFPPYQQLIPSSYPNRVQLPKADLLDAVRRVKLLVRDQHTPVRMSMRPDGVQLTAVDAEVGQAVEEIDAKLEGAELTVAFNPTFLADGVDAVDGDEVLLETLDPAKPAVIRRTEGNGFLYLLMPVRVS